MIAPQRRTSHPLVVAAQVVAILGVAGWILGGAALGLALAAIPLGIIAIIVCAGIMMGAAEADVHRAKRHVTIDYDDPAQNLARDRAWRAAHANEWQKNEAEYYAYVAQRAELLFCEGCECRHRGEYMDWTPDGQRLRCIVCCHAEHGENHDPYSWYGRRDEPSFMPEIRGELS